MFAVRIEFRLGARNVHQARSNQPFGTVILATTWWSVKRTRHA
jgi:hypothetical protein